MDNDTKLVMFMEMSGSSDVDFAKSMLEAHAWDLDTAIITMTSGDSPSSGYPPRPDNVGSGGDEVRAPMATGYTDTLMGDSSTPAQRAAEERQRREEALERKRRAEEEQAAVEAQRNVSNEEQALLSRKQAEEAAHQRRQRQRQEKLAQSRLEADPEAWKLEQERRQAEADAERQRQQNEEERQRRDAARAEAEAKKREEAGNLEAKRREEKEKEQLLRERAELEARAQQAATSPRQESKAPYSKDELLHALGALRKNYKDSNAAGLATCLKTLHTYISNLANNPTEEKYQHINCQNAAFIKRVADFDGAVAVLKAVGFTAGEDGQMAVRPDFAKTKGSSLWDALTKIDVLIKEAEAKAAAAA